jgi:hypothetical protein
MYLNGSRWSAVAFVLQEIHLVKQASVLNGIGCPDVFGRTQIDNGFILTHIEDQLRKFPCPKRIEVFVLSHRHPAPHLQSIGKYQIHGAQHTIQT